MFNLTSTLPQEDKKLIEKYIETFGTANDFIGVDEWLKHWGKEKIKLYKLFGNNFMYTVPYCYEKDEAELDQQLVNLIRDNKFARLFEVFLREDVIHNPMFFDNQVEEHCYKKYNEDQNAIYHFINYSVTRFVLKKNKIETGLKIKLRGAKKELQIQPGAKPLKAYNKILTYLEPFFKDNEHFKDLKKYYEDFRIQHSMILNDKVVKGDLVFSIHPLDFMTMSDNASNWQSCMSWSDSGCYHEGTVEMLNSNNVICCYITNKKPYQFAEDADTGEVYLWNNKRWRQLVYITPEIIMTGKSYPYKNKKLSHTILDTLRDLMKKIYDIDYDYGIEKYEDMKYINTQASMDRARDYRMLPKNRYHKKNILFDTKGMYNDILNDHTTEYWCIRNKVKKTTIISVSGKAPCLCCGGSVIKADEDWSEYDCNINYNDRYHNVGEVICPDCMHKIRCRICGNHKPKNKKFIYTDHDGVEHFVCESCFKNFFKKCPCCGENMFITSVGDPAKENSFFISDAYNADYRNYDDEYNPIIVPITKDFDVSKDFEASHRDLYKEILGENYSPECKYRLIFAHPECLKKMGIDFTETTVYIKFRSWRNPSRIVCKEVPYTPDWSQKYNVFFYDNLLAGSR